MKTSLSIKLASLILLLTLLFSCKDKGPHFIIEGVIGGADSTVLYLQKRTLTETTTIDSVKLNKDGKFNFKQTALGYPEFYLLRLEKQVINLAVDSTETIIVTADKDNFATNYLVDGSASSSNIKENTLDFYKLINTIRSLNKSLTERKIDAVAYTTQLEEAVFSYKEKAKKVMSVDYSSPAAYYSIFQKVDGLLTFDPMDKKDLPFFRAVATAWETYHAESPRTQHLREYTLRALAEIKQTADNDKALNEMLSNSNVKDASELYAINLPDQNGKAIDLASTKGKVVILDFTAYQTEYSPAHNMVLNDIYSKMKSSVEIYQISFDSDAHAWKNTANNLPWICVRDSKSLQSDLIKKYNVQNLPTTFILNKQGHLAKRIFSKDDLIKEINKLK